MKIKGFINNSFLDWDGKIASIIFTGGCNFKCPFCHNKNLVVDNEKIDDIPEQTIFDYLVKNKKWIDGVVITGGEPTLQTDLIEFMEKIKASGFLVKLDTNGYRPDVLEKAIELKLVDFVAMDIKTALEPKKYAAASGLKMIELEKIEKSIEILLKGKVDFEFRTTLCPAFVGLEDLKNIAGKIKDARWVWQNFRHSENILDRKMNLVETYVTSEIEEFERAVLRKIIRR